jgi:phosphatidylglycerophosphate synthase
MSAARRTGGSPLIGPETRARVKKLGEPIALFLGRLGLTPDRLTLIGFGITVGGAVLAAFGLWLVAGIVIFAGGAFDLFDGALARATGRVSNVGAFMDSVFDRWGEAVVYVGIVAGCVGAGFGLGAALAAFAMGSAFLVSYTRAKAEGLGFSGGTGMAEVGLAPREVRLVILTLGLVLVGLVGGIEPVAPAGGGRGIGDGLIDAPGQAWLALALGLIGILATITVIQRILHVRQQAAGSGGK